MTLHLSIAKNLRWLAAAASIACASAASAGTLIEHVRIIDGSGGPEIRGSVRIDGDRITAVGEARAQRGDQRVDGHGLVLAPGFIDTHSHHDRDLAGRPDALALLSQGVTTFVAGQDGDHDAPLADTMAKLAKLRPSVNVAFYAGHGTIRRAVMGEDFRRHARPEEVLAMKQLLKRELDAGAIGLSTGLEYDPGIYSDHSELVELAKVAASVPGGRYISHVRSEDRDFWPAIDEIIDIGRQAHLPVQVSHMKLAMVGLWGKAPELLRRLDAARAEGIDITADVYPYTAWHSDLTVLFPKRDFNDHAEAEMVLREVTKPEGLQLGHYLPHPEYAGLTLEEIAKLRHEDPATTLLTLINDELAWRKAHPDVKEDVEDVMGTSMSEADVHALIAWPHSNICSDGELWGAHPRGFGSFTRFLGRYVREDKLMPLDTAVQRMTLLAAQHVGIARRGRIAAGNYADLVLFDPATVRDRATAKEPHLASVGIRQVWVNGQVVWKDGRTTGAHAGRVLKRGDH